MASGMYGTGAHKNTVHTITVRMSVEGARVLQQCVGECPCGAVLQDFVSAGDGVCAVGGQERGTPVHILGGWGVNAVFVVK